MNGAELYSILAQDSACQSAFAGVYAADQLPLLVHIRPRLYVANTDISSKLGSHWVAFYFPEDDGPGEFFDSVGHRPDYYHSFFQSFLINNGTNYLSLTERIQGHGSNTCGLYCVFYALQRCRGHSLRTIVESFAGRNKTQNDIAMMRMIWPS